MSASETHFAGVRVRYDSTKSYEELVSALLTMGSNSEVKLVLA